MSHFISPLPGLPALTSLGPIPTSSLGLFWDPLLLAAHLVSHPVLQCNNIKNRSVSFIQLASDLWRKKKIIPFCLMAPHVLINALAANKDTKVPSHDMVLVFAHVCHDCSPPCSGRWSIPPEGSPTAKQPVMRPKREGKWDIFQICLLGAKKKLSFLWRTEE